MGNKNAWVVFEWIKPPDVLFPLKDHDNGKPISNGGTGEIFDVNRMSYDTM